ncbi:dermonecrotic toxin domain-containing protein [Sodalis sp. RH16]|uniref:dermonecrotic toxin domain-containing protein n=1 Tax=Sodalis sp. RH16 TaxID=3394331 RepID=UPI0039B5937B
MQITEGFKDYYNIYNNDSEIEFFDCEDPNYETDDDSEIYYDLPEELPTENVPFTEDLKRTLFHLIKIVTSCEADRLSLSLLYKTGLGIPFSLLAAAHSFYRLWRREENIGSVLIEGFPFFALTILPQSEKLMLLANFIKNHIEDRVGLDNLPFLAGFNTPTEGDYLVLGVLALLGEYYLAGHSVPAPRRAGLKLPVALAQLFTRICRYWHLLCATATESPTPAADPFGRIILNPAEKREQREGRRLARLWACDSRRRQIQRERIAEAYYGIKKPHVPATATGPGTDRRHDRQALAGSAASSLSAALFSTVIAPVRRALQVLAQGLMAVAMPFPAVSGAAPGRSAAVLAPPPNAITEVAATPPSEALAYPETVTLKALLATKLNLSSETLLPPETTTQNTMFRGPFWAAPYVQLRHYLRDSYPAITNIVAQQLAEAISRRFGVSINPDHCFLHQNDTSRSTPDSPVSRGLEDRPKGSLTLTEFAIKKYFTGEAEDLAALDDDYGVYRGNPSVTGTRRGDLLPFKPSDLDPLLDSLKPTAVYQHALHHYRRVNQEFHALANLIHIVNALSHHREQPSPEDIGIYMQALGLGEDGRHRLNISLFDINGCLATDLAVIEAPGAPDVLLYLPRAQQPFRRFENGAAMREWVVGQSRDSFARQELLKHFALRDSKGSNVIFGRWGVERWLENIADYPEHIWQNKEKASGLLYEIVSERQLERAWADAAYLPDVRQARPQNGYGDSVLWLNQLYALPIAPFTALEPLEGDGPYHPTARQTALQSPVSGSFYSPVPDPSRLALSLLFSAAGEILPFDDEGVIHFSDGPKIALSLFRTLINYDMQAMQGAQHVNGGIERVLTALSVMPSGYVRTLRTWPNGRIDMHFSITLPPASGQRRENLQAVRLFGKVMPLRFNSRLKAYEVFDIHHEDNAGYPVCLNEKNHWQFGRLTGREYHARWAISMAVYSNISIRLYEKLMENLNELCKKTGDLTPVNSLGIAKDADGVDYLTIKNHYFEISAGPGENVFLLRGDKNIELKIRFDNKKKKFFYISGRDQVLASYQKTLSAAMLEHGIDSRLSYRQGFRLPNDKSCRLALAAEKSLAHSGLKKIIFYGLGETEIALSPRYAPQANAIRKGLSLCDALMRELLSSKEQPRLRPLFYSALQITGAGQNIQHRAWSLFISNLKKTLALLDNHTGDDYGRVWGASFDSFAIATVALKSDPLKRLWFNVRYRQSKGPHNHYLAHYCRYGCKEIPSGENIASISRSVGKGSVTEEETLVNPVFKDDFPLLMARLQSGNMNSDEINSLVSLSEAANVQHVAFLSDKKLARQLFRTKALARVKMILNDADRFSHLLLHLHAQLNHRSCEHPSQEPVRMLLFMLAWQGI